MGASSPAVPVSATNAESLGHNKSSADSHLVGSLPQWASLNASASDSALGFSNPSCRPWERGDLLRRLSTFQLSGSAKPKVPNFLF